MKQVLESVAVMAAFIEIIVRICIWIDGKQAVEGDEEDHHRNSMRGTREVPK